MLFKKDRRPSPGSDISTVPGIEREAVEALRELGFNTVGELCAKDAEEMYYKLSLERGEVAEKELLYQFRCAIYYATVKKADPKKLRWWYWRDKDENAGLSDEELLKIYEKQPPVV